jgi:hypothetical protein
VRSAIYPTINHQQRRWAGLKLPGQATRAMYLLENSCQQKHLPIQSGQEMTKFGGTQNNISSRQLSLETMYFIVQRAVATQNKDCWTTKQYPF